MPDVIILDTGPLSNCVVHVARRQQTSSISQQCRQWIDDCEHSGRRILIPAVAYYEVLRSLELRGATSQIGRLKEFCLNGDRFMSLTTRHLESAAQLWAQERKEGKPSAGSESLDADVIITAQALSLGLPSSDYVIATTNPAHIAPFAPCDLWTNINP